MNDFDFDDRDVPRNLRDAELQEERYPCNCGCEKLQRDHIDSPEAMRADLRAIIAVKYEDMTGSRPDDALVETVRAACERANPDLLKTLGMLFTVLGFQEVNDCVYGAFQCAGLVTRDPHDAFRYVLMPTAPR